MEGKLSANDYFLLGKPPRLPFLDRHNVNDIDCLEAKIDVLQSCLFSFYWACSFSLFYYLYCYM